MDHAPQLRFPLRLHAKAPSRNFCKLPAAATEFGLLTAQALLQVPHFLYEQPARTRNESIQLNGHRVEHSRGDTVLTAECRFVRVRFAAGRRDERIQLAFHRAIQSRHLIQPLRIGNGQRQACLCSRLHQAASVRSLPTTRPSRSPATSIDKVRIRYLQRYTGVELVFKRDAQAVLHGAYCWIRAIGDLGWLRLCRYDAWRLPPEERQRAGVTPMWRLNTR